MRRDPGSRMGEVQLGLMFRLYLELENGLSPVEALPYPDRTIKSCLSNCWIKRDYSTVSNKFYWKLTPHGIAMIERLMRMPNDERWKRENARAMKSLDAFQTALRKNVGGGA